MKAKKQTKLERESGVAPGILFSAAVVVVCINLGGLIIVGLLVYNLIIN